MSEGAEEVPPTRLGAVLMRWMEAHMHVHPQRQTHAHTSAVKFLMHLRSFALRASSRPPATRNSAVCVREWDY